MRMGGMLGGGAKPDPEVAQARLDAKQRADAEKARLDAEKAETADATKAGLRGRSALLSSAGELGYPATLGGAG